MAVPAATYTTYTAIGIREDLADVIHDISPTDTVFMSNTPRIKATQKTHEWQTDALEAAASNSQLEGDDAASQTATPTVRLANYCNISRKVPRVAGSNIASDAAGRASEWTYQVLNFGLLAA